MKAALRRRLVSNVLSLYGVQFAKYVLPLVTVPYLTRVLGPSGWGLVALGQAYGAYLSLSVNYGFNFSGAREVAQFRDDRDRLSNIFASVLGAKCLLTLPCILASSLVWRWVPAFRANSLLLWMAVFAALVPCFAPTWFFIGLEELKLVAILDFSARSLATVGVFVLVHHKEDAWRVLAVMGAGSAVAFVAGTRIAYREVALRVPRLSGIWEVLRTGRSMFVSATAIGSYASGNAFILGLFVEPSLVGYYAGAEKILRACAQLYQPPYQSLFPRISNLVRQDAGRALRLVRLSAFFFLGVGLVGGALVIGTAPWLVKLILGSSYGPAIPMLRLLAIFLILNAVNTGLGGLWMVPLGMDRPFELVTLAAAAVNVGTALLLVPRLGGLGAAGAVVLTDVFAAAAMFIYLTVKRRGFWGETTAWGSSSVHRARTSGGD